MIDISALAQQCAPTVSQNTIAAIVQVESGFNPYAIGVVGGSLKKQPSTKEEALKAVNQLLLENKNFSVGIAQINRYNLDAYNITYEQAFDACKSLNIGAKILENCYTKAKAKFPNDNEQNALKRAFSCYYSGNFLRGFKPDKKGDLSYVDKIINASIKQKTQKTIVPDISIITNSTPKSKNDYKDYSDNSINSIELTNSVSVKRKNNQVLILAENIHNKNNENNKNSVLVYSKE